MSAFANATDERRTNADNVRTPFARLCSRFSIYEPDRPIPVFILPRPHTYIGIFHFNPHTHTQLN